MTQETRGSTLSPSRIATIDFLVPELLVPCVTHRDRLVEAGTFPASLVCEGAPGPLTDRRCGVSCGLPLLKSAPAENCNSTSETNAAVQIFICWRSDNRWVSLRFVCSLSDNAPVSGLIKKILKSIELVS